jgi:hypothetical protein
MRSYKYVLYTYIYMYIYISYNYKLRLSAGMASWRWFFRWTGMILITLAKQNSYSYSGISPGEGTDPLLGQADRVSPAEHRVWYLKIRWTIRWEMG